MTAHRPRRSVLYMPGSNARAHAKGRTLPADALVLDLEDSVVPELRDEAREQVVASIKEGGFGAREVAVRVNAAHSDWFEDDIAIAVRAAPDALLIPKVGSPQDIFAADRHLRGRPTAENVDLWAMIETPQGLQHVAEIAAAARDREGRRLRGLVLGTNDIVKETRVRPGANRGPLLAWISTAILAARTEGLFILDGVYNDFSDTAGFEAECVQGRDFGFDGKTLVHPGQIDTANRVFGLSEDEVAEARSIVEAFSRPENAERGVINLDGRMVERLHAEMAERTLSLHAAITAASPRKS